MAGTWEVLQHVFMYYLKEFIYIYDSVCVCFAVLLIKRVVNMYIYKMKLYIRYGVI
jgi:hypothetical protein